MVRGRHLAQGQHVKERLVGIGRRQRRMDRRRLAMHIAGGQDPAVGRHQGRSELDAHVPSRGAAQLLVELAQVTVCAADTIGMIPLRQLRMKQRFLQRPPRPRDGAFQVQHDLVGIDHPLRHQRQQGIEPRRHVAAGAGDEPRPADLVAVELRQAVDGFLLKLRGRMRLAITARIVLRIPQPEVGGKVHDLQRPRKLGDHLLRCRMRKGAKGYVDAREIDFLDALQTGQVEMAQVWKDLGHGHAGLAVGGQRSDRHVRMRRDEADQFGPRVAGGAKDGDGVRHFRYPA